MPLVEDETGYDRLAWFYNRYWGARYHRQALPIVKQLPLSLLPSGATLLDLCCGTGHLTRDLTARGDRVTGIDASEVMLRFARENAPTGDFLVRDIRAFESPRCYQVALSTFDSLNHVLELRELILVLQSVHRALSPGGSFLFDLNLEQAYRAEWGKSSAIVAEDHACIVRGDYDPIVRLGRTEITMFRLEGEWQQEDVLLFEKCHAPEEIQSALQEAGFEGIRRYEADALGMAGEIGTGRAFFLAEKRERPKGPPFYPIA